MIARLRSSRLVGPVVGMLWFFCVWFAQDRIHALTTGETEFVELPSDYLGVTIDPRVIQRLLGLRLIAADLIWIDTLIKSDLRHEKVQYTPIYHAFKAVVTLDPDDLNVYYVAGMYLSVVKDDVRGATAILKMGADYMETHPYVWWEAWRLPWTLGYNLMFEENDIEGGSRWIQKAASMVNVPLMVRNLAKHVSTETGRLEIAERVLNDAFRRATRPEEKQRFEAKMLEIGARHELLDLNSRFQAFLQSTKASDFSKKRQFQVFIRSLGHSGKDLMGRKLGIDSLGKIAPIGSTEN